MYELLQKLYRGELNPSNGGTPDSQEFKTLAEELTRVEAALFRKTCALSPDIAEKYRDFLHDYNYLMDMEQEQSFIDGFRLGVQLMTAAALLPL